MRVFFKVLAVGLVLALLPESALADTIALGGGVQTRAEDGRLLPAPQPTGTSGFLTGRLPGDSVEKIRGRLEEVSQRVESSNSLLDALSIDVQVDARYGAFKGDASFNRIRTSYSEGRALGWWYGGRKSATFRVIHPDACLSTLGRAHVRRIREATSLAAAQKLYRQFVASAGDEMIWSIKRTMIVAAVYELESQSSFVQEQLIATLRAKYGAFGSASAMIETLRREEAYRSRVKTGYFLSTYAVASVPAASAPDDLLARPGSAPAAHGAALAPLGASEALSDFGTRVLRALERGSVDQAPVAEYHSRSWWRVLGLSPEVDPHRRSGAGGGPVHAARRTLLRQLNEDIDLQQRALMVLRRIQTQATRLGDKVRGREARDQSRKARARLVRMLKSKSQVVVAQSLDDVSKIRREKDDAWYPAAFASSAAQERRPLLKVREVKAMPAAGKRGPQDWRYSFRVRTLLALPYPDLVESLAVLHNGTVYRAGSAADAWRIKEAEGNIHGVDWSIQYPERTHPGVEWAGHDKASKEHYINLAVARGKPLYNGDRWEIRVRFRGVSSHALHRLPPLK